MGTQEKQREIEENIAYIERLIKEGEVDEQNREMQQVCESWLNMVFSKVLKHQYEQAKKAFFGIYSKNDACQNTRSAIFAFMFQVHDKEQKNGEESIFSILTSRDQMEEIYYELKFLIRRFEYDLPDCLKEELIPFLRKYPVSVYAILEVTDVYILKKEKVLNEIAVFLFERKYYEYVLPLLQEAFRINQENPETLYHLSYVLYAFGESEIALTLMQRIKNRSETYMELYQAIEAESALPKQKKMREEKGEPQKLSVPDGTEKIAFISCVDDDRQFEECCHFIRNLLVPEGYCTEIVPVYHAKSMAGGYQEGMKKTDARYKIYLHQDVLCTDRYLLYELLSLFIDHPDIGMAGVAGSVKMSPQGLWWKAKKEEKFYLLYQDAVILCTDNDWEQEKKRSYNCGGYQEVSVLDGCFLATSKDVDWREDLFYGWHHYDVSQSMEFKRRGYKVVIPKPREPWVLHNDKWGRVLLNDYWKSALSFLKEYKEDIIK